MSRRMSRYIDAEELEDELYEHEFSNWCDKDEVSELIDNMPTVDVEPVRHGRWIKHYECCDAFVCSECGAPSIVVKKYCCECGAKMDRKEQENE